MASAAPSVLKQAYNQVLSTFLTYYAVEDLLARYDGRRVRRISFHIEATKATSLGTMLSSVVCSKSCKKQASLVGQRSELRWNEGSDLRGVPYSAG